eukprot:TRINITY_DN13643_c0_g1_i1.p2 TRINITY_DN13643_c0_g1~~TRINITY_DN13643_c0_g1_i1.p2  ORF type:complete len:188 (+),score=56.67 TRINITY_DN13643_c0_g1_i1:120-683(+)
MCIRDSINAEYGGHCSRQMGRHGGGEPVVRRKGMHAEKAKRWQNNSTAGALSQELDPAQAKAMLAKLKKEAKEMFPGKSCARKRREWIAQQGTEVCNKRKRGEEVEIVPADEPKDMVMGGTVEAEEGGKRKRVKVLRAEKKAADKEVDAMEMGGMGISPEAGFSVGIASKKKSPGRKNRPARGNRRA